MSSFSRLQMHRHAGLELTISRLIRRFHFDVSIFLKVVPLIFLSLTILGVVDTAVAITPQGSGNGGSSTSPSTSVPRHESQPAKSSKGTLQFPKTAEEMRRLLGRGGNKGGGRDMAALDAAGFGSFIEFDHDSAAVIPDSGLYEILKALTTPPLEAGEHITITGHTDGDGSDSYNMDLSYRRANAVRAWLITNGVRPDALRANGAGETQPIDTNATETGKRRNRRVEFSAKSW